MNEIILAVDDNKVSLGLLSQILSSDYCVLTAADGEMAISIMEKSKPDLVLLDVYMPGLDGMDVLTYMNQSPELSAIPVIFITSEHDVQMEQRGLEMGAVDYVRKPYNAAVISHKVRNHLFFKSCRDHLETVVQERTRQLSASREAIIMAMSFMSESHDKVTGSHIERIKLFTRILCRHMREMYPDLMTPDQIEHTTLYSPLHDIGKVGISDGILKKGNILTPQEFDIIKTHTVTGADLLRRTVHYLKDKQETSQMGVAVEIAECHHEKYDGTGYPHGLKGDEIPLSARIVSIVDVYDALRSVRPYKKALTHKNAIKIILEGDGRTMPEHFDPKVLNAFLRAVDDFDISYE